MKKSIFMLAAAGSLFAAVQLTQMPISGDFISTDNGGNISAEEAYKDGVGFIIADSKINNSAMNRNVFSKGAEAAEAGETLGEYLLDNGNAEEKLAAPNVSIYSGTPPIAPELPTYTVGSSCDDGNPGTNNDVYINTSRGCQGDYIVGYNCNDGDGLTTGDVYTDISGTCAGTDLYVVGATCNDGDSLTNYDVYTNRDGSCAGTDIFTAGTPCDDGDPLTEFDMITGRDGTCVGGDIYTAGTSCDDGFVSTINDVIVDRTGACAGTDDLSLTTLTCENRTVGTNFDWNGESYLVVDDSTIAANISNAENLCTTHVTNMSELFQDSTLNPNISMWDTSNVTNMSHMFKNAINFNQELNDWDVSKVTNMRGLFYNAETFNKSLNNWDVSNVTSMETMFREAINFNRDINNWDVSNVTTMNGMFLRTSRFNQPLDNWDISNVKLISYMFYESIFNQPLNNWDTSNVTSIEHMFYKASYFNQPLNNWDTSKVTQMTALFFEATEFNQPLNNWDTGKVTNMRAIFHGATSFNQDITNWDVSNVTLFSNAFYGASTFNQDLSTWSPKLINTEPNGFFTTSGNNNNIYHLPKRWRPLESCKAILDEGLSSGDGVYTIDPDDSGAITPFQVYCDMTTDGGGWTVFQKRDSASDFYQNWASYKNGFGSISGNHWLGNDKLHELTKDDYKELRVVFEFEGTNYYSHYNKFQLGNESEKYKLNIFEQSGTTADSLAIHNGQPFSTYDQDNDSHTALNCAERFSGAWWYTNCHASHLNGLYLNGVTTEYAKGMIWAYETGTYYSSKSTKMMLR